MYRFFLKSNKDKGFTLIELMVVIFIFTIFTSLSIYNYRNLRDNVSLQNLADDIALTIRKAQSYSIGVRGINNSFNIGYGMHFNMGMGNDDILGNYKSFILFADINNNHKYDTTGNKKCGNPTEVDECLEIFTITGNNRLEEILVENNSDILKLSDEQSLDFVFVRPNPEPVFCIDDGNCLDFTVNNAYIKILNNTNENEMIKQITISNSGQISVFE